MVIIQLSKHLALIMQRPSYLVSFEKLLLPFQWLHGTQTEPPPCVQSRPGDGRCRALLWQYPEGIGPRRLRWPEPTAR